MVLVEEAEKLILQQSRDFGTEMVSFDQCLGRVLAEPIAADRDLPPFNRVTMDGIAIQSADFRSGFRSFQIRATQSAGEEPFTLDQPGDCIEIMTGAVLPASADAVIPYEDINIFGTVAQVRALEVTPHQNIHLRGKDKRKDDVLVEAGRLVTPAEISVAAAVGKTRMLVYSRPRCVVVSTGDELVAIEETPTPYQIRRSNNYALQAALSQFGITPDVLHLPDDKAYITAQLEICLDRYDVILMSGGVSMGKFDYVPASLEALSVTRSFHKVRQRPGKPFWFGTHARGTLVFAFPGNPVATFMCFYRYFIPWLKGCWKLKTQRPHAVLGEDFTFTPFLQYFVQVRLRFDAGGTLVATPLEGNGSGDFANLLLTDGFLELPADRNAFKKGEIFPIWAFKDIIR